MPKCKHLSDDFLFQRPFVLRTHAASSMPLSVALCGVPVSQVSFEIRTCFLRAGHDESEPDFKQAVNRNICKKNSDSVLQRMVCSVRILESRFCKVIRAVSIYCMISRCMDGRLSCDGSRVQKYKEVLRMARCAICDKGAHFGNNVSHSHRRSNHMWKSNIKHVSCKVNGESKKIYVCTSCLRSGRVERA